MAASCEKESKERQSKKLTKPHNELLENTERDLQIIFKKLRVDNHPKRLKSKNGSRINKSREIEKKRKILKEPTFIYKSVHQIKTAADSDTSSWTLSINSNDGEFETIDKKIPWTIKCKNSKSSSQDQKFTSELSESCSEQFRRAQCSTMSHGSMNFDDTTPEELAAYFDQLLHIPKPMSAMAEMMYT